MVLIPFALILLAVCKDIRTLPLAHPLYVLSLIRVTVLERGLTLSVWLAPEHLALILAPVRERIDAYFYLLGLGYDADNPEYAQ